MSAQTRRNLIALLAALPLLAYLVYPVLALLIQGLTGPILSHRAEALGWDPARQPFAAGVLAAWRDPQVERATWGTLALAFWTVVLGGLWGTGLALLWHRRDFFGRGGFALCGYAPLLMPPLVGTLAFFRLLGRSGSLWQWLPLAGGKPWLTPFGAVLVLHVYSFGLYSYAFAAAALKNLDASQEEAAVSLGGTRWRAFLHGVWPALRGPVFAAGLLTFMGAGASFSGPYILDTDGHYLTVEILNLQQAGDRGRTAAVTAWLACLSLAALPAFLALRQDAFPGAGTKGAARHELPPARKGEALVRFALSVLAALILLAPPAIVLLSAVSDRAGWYDGALEIHFSARAFAELDARDGAALQRSLLYAAGAALLTVGLAVLAGLALRRARAWAAWPAETAVMLAVALPGSAVAVALLCAFNGPSWLAGGAALGQSSAILILAYVVRGLPLAVRPVRAALDGVGAEQEQAARSLGATPARAVRRVLLPLLRPTLLAAGLLCFVLAAGEYVASELLWGIDTQPVSVRIREVYRSNFPRAAALSLCLMLLCALAAAASAWLQERGALRRARERTT
ncbi:MAG: ABC transporter permease subunit [Planctomycetota bacterium]|nr:ABC transporter permease subunit [Planctomycetota bacterium]